MEPLFFILNILYFGLEITLIVYFLTWLEVGMISLRLVDMD